MINNIIIESSTYSGFYKIKEYDKYLISREGLVLNINKNICLKGSVNPKGYKNYRLTRNDNYTYTWGLHRLLCYVFKSENIYDSALTVNHIDGNKSNNDLSNLEWCTYKQQQEHAGSISLTNKCLPVTVKDLNTNEILHFTSIYECSVFYKVSKDFINWRIKKCSNIIWPENRQYKINLKNVEWSNKDSITNNGTKKLINVKFLLTNVIKLYGSISDAAFDIGVNLSTLSTWLNKKNQPVLPGLIQVKYNTDKSPWRNVLDCYSELELFTKNKVIKIIDPKTNEIHIFETASKAANFLNISATCLNYRLNNKVFSNGLICSYYTT